MVVRGPATSISAGATHMSVSVRSRSQASSRSRTPFSSGQASTATVSASKWLTADVTLPSPPKTGTPRDLVQHRPARQAGPHHIQAVVGVAAQFGDEVGHRGGMAEGHHPVHAGAAAAQLVQPLAQAVPNTRSRAVTSGSDSST